MADNLKQRKQDLVDIDAKIKAIDKSQSNMDKRYKEEIKLKKKFQKELNDLTEKQKEIVKEIGRLEKNNASNAVKELKLKKTVSDLDKQIVKSEKEKQKSISGRLVDLLKLDFSSVLQKQNLTEQLEHTLKLQKVTKTVAQTIQASVKDEKDKNAIGNLEIEDKAKVIELVKGIKEGTYDVTDLQSTFNSLSEEGQEIMKKRLATEEDSVGKTIASSDLMSGILEAKEAETKQIQISADLDEKRLTRQKMSNVLAGFGLAIFAATAKLATSFATILDSIGKSFGSLTEMGPTFQKDLMASSVEARKLGGGMEEVASITNTLASNFGVNVDEAARLSSEVFKTSKAIGLSADEGANLIGVLMQTADLSFDQAEYLAESTAQLARQKGVAPSAVMKDLAGSAEAIAKFTKDGGDNIAEAAVQARIMGLTLDTSAKIADSLLDFQSSISGEIEASVMIGKQLNFQKARELALSGDIAGATKDIVSQLGSEAEFNKLNVLQREALAKSIGVSTAELAKMVGQTDKLTLSGALAAGSFDDLAGQEALSNLSSITSEIKAMFTDALIKIGPEIERIIGKFKDWLEVRGGVEGLFATFSGIVDSLAKMIKYIPIVIGLLVAMKTYSLAAAAASAVLAVSKASAATALIGGIGGLAVAGVIGLGVSKALSFMKVDDFKAGPGGIDFISGPAGAFNVNPRDTIVGTTNRVNDFESGPPGSISDDKSDANHKETISILTQGFKNLTAATLAPMPLRFATMNGEILARTADKIGGKLSPYG
jgi:hypothetical protein